MKKLFISLLLLAFPLLSDAHINTSQPFIIQGQLDNCPEEYLKIFFEGENGETLIDTIHLDEKGKFFLKTYKVLKPHQSSIQQNNIQINNIFVAPGYNLTITGDGKDFKSLFKSKKISGVGAESNAYRFMLDSILIARNDTTRWFELKGPDLLAYANKDQQLKESVAHVAFNQEVSNDPYFTYFKKVVDLDITFHKLYLLLTHVNFSRNVYSYNQSVDFVRKNFDTDILDHISKDEYLISETYKTWIITGEYLQYVLNLDYKKDSLLKEKAGYKLEKIDNIYTGEVKDYALNKVMRNSIIFCKTIEKLKDYEEIFTPYISKLDNKEQRKLLEEKLTEKERELISTQVGQPAPLFTLQDSSGRFYSLQDFKGKVVYLDFWASWCKPCRAETPHLEKLYEKYKDDERLEIIGIAVSDGIEKWKKALHQDQPDWLQLVDKDDMVKKAYTAYSIPRYILIDKDGKIINFNAPRPSDAENLEQLIEEELAKN